MAVPAALSEDAMEVVAQGLDSDGEMVDRALEVVRQFIADRGMTLYGGLGLDFSLKLRGGRIYPDGERPDYDALSPRNVDDAYELADILHGRGFPRVRAIPALHIQTMRVQVDFAVVADLSFAPAAVLAAMPTLVFDADGGPAIRVIHPHWQYMDQHLAFCFPFRDPPREPVFHRFGKDVARFNLLHARYPLPEAAPAAGSDAGRAVVALPLDDECALHGEAGRALLRRALAAAEGEITPAAAAGLATHEAGGRRFVHIEVAAARAGFAACLVTCAAEPAAVLARLGYRLAGRHNPLMDVLPEVLVGELADAEGGEAAAGGPGAKKGAGGSPPRPPAKLLLFCLPGRLLASTRFCELDFPGGPALVRFTSPQCLLLHYLMGYHAVNSEKSEAPLGTALQGLGLDADAFLAGYHDVLGMVNRGAGRLGEAVFAKKPQVANATPFALTTDVLGSDNYGERQLLSIAKDAQSTKQAPKGIPAALIPPASEINRVPWGYEPARKRPKPAFEYAKSPWFRWDGAAQPRLT